MTGGTTLCREYNIEAVSLHDWHALVSKPVVEVHFVTRVELINAELIDRLLGLRSTGYRAPKESKECKLLHTRSFEEQLLARILTWASGWEAVLESVRCMPEDQNLAASL